jgi:hypothetical protein
LALFAVGTAVTGCSLRYGGRVPEETAAEGRRCKEDTDCAAGLPCIKRRCRILCKKGCPENYTCDGEAPDGTPYCRPLRLPPPPMADGFR